MNRERMDQLIEVANGLSNDDLCYLINLISDRCDVFIGSMGGRLLESQIVWASLNGVQIQINLDTCELDSLSEVGEWWRDAILDEAKHIRARDRAAKKGGAA